MSLPSVNWLRGPDLACGPYDLQVFAPMKTCTNVGRKKKLGNPFDIGLLLTSFKTVQRF